jgi:predicted nucleotidyltransferase
VAEGLRRAMLRTEAGPLRPLWSAAYSLVARALTAYLRRGHRRSSAYLFGSVAGSSVVHGVSDIDLAIVAAAPEGASGANRAAIERRWDRLRKRVPSLDQLVYLAAYEDAELKRAAAGSPCLTYGLGMPESEDRGKALFQPRLVDPAALTTRPGLHRPMTAWRLLAGRERRPPAVGTDAQHRRLAGWLELQYWWWYVFDACVDPGGPRKAYLFVKLASEPVRVWDWVVSGMPPLSRRDALQRGSELFPEERPTFERARELLDALNRSPDPSLSDFLPTFVRLTARVGERLQTDVEAAGFTEVRVIGGELALRSRAEDPLRALTSRRPRLLPLVDWRALARPALPDEAFSPIDGNVADAAVIAAAAVAGRSGPYPALRHDRLLTLPTSLHRRAVLRSVQCPVTDPVSFALLDGAPSARFPNARGWSIEDTATRAVSEHRAWLAAHPGEGGDGVEELAMLFSAGRAALLLESVRGGAPELALTAEAVARRLGDGDPGAGSVALEAYDEYRTCRGRDGQPDVATVSALRACVLGLAPYAGPDRAGVSR